MNKATLARNGIAGSGRDPAVLFAAIDALDNGSQESLKSDKIALGSSFCGETTAGLGLDEVGNTPIIRRKKQDKKIRSVMICPGAPGTRIGLSKIDIITAANIAHAAISSRNESETRRRQHTETGGLEIFIEEERTLSTVQNLGLVAGANMISANNIETVNEEWPDRNRRCKANVEIVCGTHDDDRAEDKSEMAAKNSGVRPEAAQIDNIDGADGNQGGSDPVEIVCGTIQGSEDKVDMPTQMEGLNTAISTDAGLEGGYDHVPIVSCFSLNLNRAQAAAA